ncbi:GAF domain-containing protein [Phormidium tenue FACHB-886]|nr:GAF domain-containing protein [Phormidium tenue FACHB-886]
MNEDHSQDQGSASPQYTAESEPAWKGTTEAIGSICLTLNPAGYILSSDRPSADFLGYDLDLLIGQPIAILIHLRDQARLYAELTEALSQTYSQHNQTIHSFRSQFCLVSRDGRCLEVQSIGRILQGTGTIMLLECQPLDEQPLMAQSSSQQANSPTESLPPESAAVPSLPGSSGSSFGKNRHRQHYAVSRPRSSDRPRPRSSLQAPAERHSHPPGASLAPQLEPVAAVQLNPHAASLIRDAALLSEEEMPLFSSIFSAIEAPIFVVDVLEGGNFRYVALNPAHERQMGIRATDLVGRTPEQVLSPPDAVAVQQHYSDCVRLGMTISYEEYLPFSSDAKWWLTTLTPLRSTDSRVHRLIGTSTNITHRKQIEEALQQQIEQQQLIATIAQRIRASLDLNTILQRTVEEVRQFLQTDRVLIYRFEPDWSGTITVESVAAPWTAVLGTSFQDPCFTASHIDRYRQGRIQVVTDIYAAGLNQCHIDLLASLQVRANLVVPIIADQDLWGLLIAQHCCEPRLWETPTIELLKQLATQVGIAVYQAELHNQVQSLNTHLEFQVKERTLQLQQALDFEAVMRRITEKVRDSLDESQILQGVTAELAQVLQVHRCQVELYNPLHTTATIVCESITASVTASSAAAQGQSHPIADFPEIYTPLLAGQIVQFVEAASLWSSALANVTRLACPIRDDQGTLGNLWLLRSRKEHFDDFEIQLVEQVADQCAIAIRQARLYETAQTQIEALEKFISLKDEFLTSVSHELCTPMSSIHLAAQTLEKLLHESGELTKENSTIARTLAILKQECQRETRVIQNLLTISYAEGEELLAPVLIDLASWLPQIIEPFQALTVHRQQQLQLTIAENLPLLELDLAYLERIVNELLNNACKYTPAHGLIQVSAVRLPHALQLAVTNSGATIDPEDLTHLFEKFYRGSGSDVWEYGGAGLGLAVVKKLVERLKATIAVTSNDQEITFTITFPIA